MPTSALHVARTGLEAQDTRMRVIANNLANVGTTGFKKDRANFATLAYQDARVAGQRSSGETAYATADGTVSKGVEFEINGALTDNWQMTFGATRFVAEFVGTANLFKGTVTKASTIPRLVIWIWRFSARAHPTAATRMAENCRFNISWT